MYCGINKYFFLDIERMKEVFFGPKIVQKGGRIKIPIPIMQSLNLREGDRVQIILDAKSEEIVIRKIFNQNNGK